MKKRKILCLFPLIGLLLTGCDFKEVLKTAKDWTGSNIYYPIRNWITGEETPQEEENSEKEEQQHEEEKQIKRIVIEAAPEQVIQGSEVAKESVSIRVYYSDNSSEVVTPETVSCNTSEAGDAELIAHYKGFEASKTITVVSQEDVIHVASFRWEVEKRTIYIGETLKINITIEPDDATDQVIIFSSDNEEVLTVSADGLVTGIAVGQATVHMVSHDNPEAKKDLTLTVAEVPAGLPGATTLGYTRLEKDEALLNGEKVNIAGAVGSDYYVLPNYSDGNNIKGKAISEVDGALDIAQDDEFTIITNDDGTVSFLEANGKYLAATGTSGNQLKEVESIETRSKFNVSVNEEGYATVQAPGVTRGIMALNPNNGTPLFNCYSSASSYSPIVIYHNGEGQQGGQVEGVQFTSESYEVEKGSTVKVLANVLPATAENKGVSYELKDLEPAGCMEINGDVVTGVEIGTGVVVAKSDENPEITAEVAISVIEPVLPDHAGTLDDPYDVSDAIIVIDKGVDLTDKYVKGIVSKIVTAYSETHKNISFNISEDGSQEGPQLQGYRTKGDDAANVEVGDTALLHGDLTIYGSTYELAQGNQLVELVKKVYDVESVTLDQHAASMQVGLADLTLSATVLPEKASQELEWTSSNEEVATVENGVVHAVGAGEATIKAQSVDYPERFDECIVNVTVPVKEVTGVTVSSMPKVEYTEGEKLDLTNLVLTISYNDESQEEGVVSGYTTNIALDHELTLEDTSLVITYGGVEAEPITLTINEKAKPVHAGTLEDPYTVSDAKIIFDDLASGAISSEVYVTGTIAETPAPKISGGRGQFYLTDGSETDLYVYNINNIGGSNNLTLADIPAGSVVVGKGAIKNYQGTFEFCYNKENPAIACELISVDKPVIVPATVTISGATSVQEEKTITLTAEVGPVGAPQDVVWSVEIGSEHASVDQNGVVTGIAEGAATIRATAVDHSDVYGEYEVSITAKPDTPSEEAYRLVTDASDLADGSTIVISNNDSTYAMGAYAGGNNVPAVAVTASDGVLEPGTASVLTLEDAGDGHFYIKLGSGYLYAAASSKNQLKVKDAKDAANGVWEFSYVGGHMSIIAFGSSNRNVMQFNPNNGSPIFACYASASQTALQVYRYC